jgi:hypothetical protein
VGRHELPLEPGVVYGAFCDPSGGVRDAMTLAIGHLDRRNVCVLDALLEIRAPFDPEAAVRQCAQVLRRYGVSIVVGDHYAGQWAVARFKESGIEFVQSARAKSDLYLDFLSLLNAGRVELLDNLRLRAQLVGLERRTARSGRDTVDHARGAHDDSANAVAGVLVMLDLDRRPALVKLEDVIGEENAADPAACEYVVLVVSDAGPDLAAVFVGSSRAYRVLGESPPPSSPDVLYVLDVDVTYFRTGLFEELAGRIGEWGWRLRAPGWTIIAPEHLVAQFSRFGTIVNSPPKDFKPELWLTPAAESIGAGKVRFCSAVRDKMNHETIGAALALKAGDEVETAMRTTLLTAIWAKHAPA